jgi:hypothetical protein
MNFIYKAKELMNSFWTLGICVCALLAGCADVPRSDSSHSANAMTPAPANGGLAALIQAAESGILDAQFTLAQMYEVGRKGVGMDLPLAFKWYTKAAEAGYVPAQYFLGGMYASSRGTPLDISKAIFWFRKAADQGYTDAIYPVAYAYENGLGDLPQDNAQALAWYRKSADAGNTFAFQRLAKAYRLGELGLTVDAAQAEQYDARIKPGKGAQLMSIPVGKQP